MKATFNTILSAAAVSFGVLALGGAGTAQAAETVVIGYQTVVDPSKAAQADGLYEKATGVKIDWRKFDSGAEVIAAIASGAIQIGYVGSSPLAAAASREAPIQTVLVAALIGEAEALVTRNGAGVTEPKDLAGKTVAVPFVSTTHYSLLAALKHWSIEPKSVRILNLRPPEIAAAWGRGDIDAAYVWDPALGKIKESGKVLTTSAEVAKWGAPTFDAWIARKDFVAKHPDVVKGFVKTTLDAYAAYRADPTAWKVGSPQVEKIARLTGAKTEEVPELLTGNYFPLAEEQASAQLLGGGTVKSIADTAAFLKEQGKIDAVSADYSPYVDARFVKQSVALK